MIQVANFRRHVQDQSKGKHIFLDLEIPEQELAQVFYDTIRNLILEWGQQYGTLKVDFTNENGFLQAFYFVYGGDPNVQIESRFT